MALWFCGSFARAGGAGCRGLPSAVPGSRFALGRVGRVAPRITRSAGPTRAPLKLTCASMALWFFFSKPFFFLFFSLAWHRLAYMHPSYFSTTRSSASERTRLRLTPASLSFSPLPFFLFVFFPKLRLSPFPQPCSNPTLKVTQPSTQNPVSHPCPNLVLTLNLYLNPKP